MQNLCAKQTVSSKLVCASVEVHESAIADGESRLICCCPSFRICTFSAGEEIAGSDANCCLTDDCTIHSVWEVWSADKSLESEEFRNHTIADCIWAAIDAAVELTKHTVEILWLQSNDCTVNWNVVVGCYCAELRYHSL